MNIGRKRTFGLIFIVGYIMGILLYSIFTIVIPSLINTITKLNLSSNFVGFMLSGLITGGISLILVFYLSKKDSGLF